MHKDFNQKKMLSNFFLMIRRLTGISKTTNVHLIPKDASEYLINNESHFNELKSRLTDYLMSMESDHDSIQDEDFDERKLEIVSLPPMEYQMKFKIVQDISPEDVVDFHIGKRRFILTQLYSVSDLSVLPFSSLWQLVRRPHCPIIHEAITIRHLVVKKSQNTS